MVPSTSLASITNPLVIVSQLENRLSSSVAPKDLDIFTSSLLTQTAGILLRLPQSIIATSIVLLQRYLIARPPLDVSDPPQQLHDLSATAIYLTAKLSSTPLSTRNIVNVYAFLTDTQSSPLPFINHSDNHSSSKTDPIFYYVSEGTYERQRQTLFSLETTILAQLAFNTQVALPYTLALTYISALGHASNKLLTENVLAHLNSALLSPQLLYLTHQPNDLAVAAIYLTAREKGVKLVEGCSWWEVFDVEREVLGFVVMAMGSVRVYAEAMEKDWKDGKQEQSA